jgi:hypothetical protein
MSVVALLAAEGSVALTTIVPLFGRTVVPADVKVVPLVLN